MDADEARAALAGGADVIDVKDPAAGALGAADPATLRAIRAVVTPPAELSAALGDAPVPGTLGLAADAASCGADYVKVGLAGLHDAGEAGRLLARVVHAARKSRPGTRVVAVAYADAARAGALPALDVPAIARNAGAHGVLLDTFAKDGQTSLYALGERDTGAFLYTARAYGLLAGLAGSLGLDDVARAAALGADLMGVRGAACEGGRLGRVTADRVRGLKARLVIAAARA